METGSPLISIVIPCRNEERFIAKCLDSLIENDYPKERIEILVVDGMSDDGTREVVNAYSRKCNFVKLLKNPEKVTPVAMNRGIRNAAGEVIILVNAHSILDKEFLSLNIEYLESTRADAVGGKLNTINNGSSVMSHAIPLAADSVFGSGGRRYRNRTDEGFVYDTLPYCSYAKKTFETYGYIDEELIRNQDEEFNYRILKGGGKIFFTPKIRSLLHIRPSLKKLWKQHFQYGQFKPLVAMKVGAAVTWRQSIPALFVGSIMGSLALSIFFEPFLWVFLFILSLYLASSLAFSFHIAVKKGLKYFPVLPVVFSALHVSYGSGYLKGMWDFLILKKNKRKKIEDVPLTR